MRQSLFSTDAASPIATGLPHEASARLVTYAFAAAGSALFVALVALIVALMK